MILAKQGILIIRFEHNKGSFQSKQSLLYELNLRSLPLDQAQDATKVEIHHTKHLIIKNQVCE